jgi:hypothetical protein
VIGEERHVNKFEYMVDIAGELALSDGAVTEDRLIGVFHLLKRPTQSLSDITKWR